MYKFIIGAETLVDYLSRGKLTSQGISLLRTFLCFRKTMFKFFYIEITDFYSLMDSVLLVLGLLISSSFFSFRPF